ncbi:MAG: iron-sulfur cluster repair di-iron protein [Acidobacteria bacterium]|nr:iron-sulfur cluster repair di-iron protein [Acidobacteriota bacterium]MBI3469981.1 iron-sulfur cluster repair di-iron protein [Candidatus Solibacter usitatus]
MTITEQQTVAEVAAQSLGAVRTFEKHGIDYCCGGKRPLEEVCREKGLATGQLLAELASATSVAGEQDKDWQSASMRSLIGHIVQTHHAYLKRELPALTERFRKVVFAHGERDGAVLLPMEGIFADMREELEAHMYKEEFILFPMIGRYEAAAEAGAPLPMAPFGSIANPIRMMEREHDSAGGGLARIRELSGGFELPAHACGAYRALYQGLQELEADLHVHIHLENNILFPRVIRLEAGR